MTDDSLNPKVERQLNAALRALDDDEADSPTLAELVAYRRGELDATAHAGIQERVARSAGLRDLLARWDDEWSPSGRRRTPPSELVAAVGLKPPARSGIVRRLWHPAPAYAFAAAALCAWLFLAPRSGPPRPLVQPSSTLELRALDPDDALRSQSLEPIEIDLSAAEPLTMLRLWLPASAAPAEETRYEFQLSAEGKSWSAPIAAPSRADGFWSVTVALDSKELPLGRVNFIVLREDSAGEEQRFVVKAKLHRRAGK